MLVHIDVGEGLGVGRGVSIRGGDMRKIGCTRKNRWQNSLLGKRDEHGGNWKQLKHQAGLRIGAFLEKTTYHQGRRD